MPMIPDLLEFLAAIRYYLHPQEVTSIAISSPVAGEPLLVVDVAWADGAARVPIEGEFDPSPALAGREVARQIKAAIRPGGGE
jgi:hypothetical protein